MLIAIRHGKTRCGQVLNTSALHSTTNRTLRFLISFHSTSYLSSTGWTLMQTILHLILGCVEQVLIMVLHSVILSQVTVLWTSIAASTLNDSITIFLSSKRLMSVSTAPALLVLSWQQNRRRQREKRKKKKGRRKVKTKTRRKHCLRTRRVLKRKSSSMLTLLFSFHMVRIQNASSSLLRTKEERL